MTGTTQVNGSVLVHEGGALSCAYCGGVLPGTPATYLSLVPVRVGPPGEAGPHIFADPAVYVDVDVVFRQYYCPHCYTALQSEVVPA